MVSEFVNRYIANPAHLMNVTIEITSQCNLKCCHCYIEDRISCQTVRYLDVKSIEKVIDEAYKLKAITVTLTGGEPLMHPEFPVILKLIKERGFLVFLKTNGTLINSKNIQYIKKHVDSIILSRYGFSAETYEAVTGVKKSYDMYCNSLSLLKQYQIPYKENAILLRENESEIELFLSSNMKIEQYISTHKDNPYAGKHRPSDGVLFQYYAHRLQSSSDLTHMRFDDKPYDTRVCNCGMCSLTITSHGDVIPCTNFNYVLGNISDQSLEKIWNSRNKAEVMDKCRVGQFTKCIKCDKNSHLLSMAPCNNYAETGSINNVSEEMCRHCRIVEAVTDELETKDM